MPLHAVGRAPGPAAQSRAPRAARPDPGYLHHVSGNPADAVVESRSGTAMLGGGSDLDEAYRWMIDHARGGDFLVIRASGGFDLDTWVYSLGGLDSAETLLMTTREGADSSFVAERVRGAEVVFFAGGDQSNYVRLCADTGLERAIEERMRTGHLVLGGTSAGLAILGGVDYSAEHESLASPDALADPFHRDLTLSRALLTAPFLDRVITDSHFAERHREGRMIAFLARIQAAGWLELPRGIGVDENAGLLVEADGIARAIGGSSWLFDTTRPPSVCEAGRPLTHLGTTVRRLDPGMQFDLAHWQSAVPLPSQTVDVKRGVLGIAEP